MQACTHTHTYIYQTHIYQGCTNTPLDMGHRHTQTFADSHIYTDTPVCPCSLGHALVGAGPCLPTHSSTACRPHCRASPHPSHSSLCGLWPAGWTGARKWGLGSGGITWRWHQAGERLDDLGRLGRKGPALSQDEALINLMN